MGFDLSEIWDTITEEISYFFSFEWFGDMGDFFSGFFENLGELSIVGVIYGIILVVLVYLFRNSVFVLVHNILLKILFYVAAFIMGYMMGRKVWE